MSDVKVTREHRQRALAFKWRTFDPPKWASEWLDTGTVKWCAESSVIARIAAELHELAHMDATAERRVRASMIERLQGLYARQYETDAGPCVVEAFEIWRLVKELEAANDR